MQEFIDSDADWLMVFYLPAYAPDLNPVAGIWPMLKARLTNARATNVNHLLRMVKRQLKMIQYQESLVNGCLTQTGLIMEAA